MKLKIISLVTAISFTTTPTMAQVSIEKSNFPVAQNLPSEEKYNDYISPVLRSDRIKSLKSNSKQRPDFLTNRSEDVRDNREDRRDNREDLGDRFEDIRDNREDRRDNKEDLGDRFEDVRDNREDRRDHSR